MQLDKKVSGGEIKFVLARRIGAVEFGHQVPLAPDRASPQPSTLNPQPLDMSAVSETIVREYFELHEFLVRQHRKYISQTRREEDDDIDFFVLNPASASARGSAALCAGLAGSARPSSARLWSSKAGTRRPSAPRVLARSPEIFRFVEPKVFQQAARAFGKDGAPLKILVVPALPQAAEARDESIALLRSKGVDAVIPFRTMLADLVSETAGQPQLPEVRPAPDHPHPQELRLLPGAAVGAVPDETEEAGAEQDSETSGLTLPTHPAGDLLVSKPPSCRRVTATRIWCWS